jgi:hypothetical protein
MTTDISTSLFASHCHRNLLYGRAKIKLLLFPLASYKFFSRWLDLKMEANLG